MARMTKRFPDGKAVVVCDSCEQKKDKQCTFSECRASLIKRLAAYEDIAELCGGVDRLREFAEADKDGRLVMLPCKVGDTVWIVGAVRKLYSAKVRTFFCGHPSAVRGDDDHGRMHMIRTTECDIPMQDIGKTVFFTREEAEKALQEMEAHAD